MGYFLGTMSLILSVYMESFNLEITVILYGLFHGLGGASVAINLGMMAYIGDIATHETKVTRSRPTQTFSLNDLRVAYTSHLNT